jgi:hypothetical protein
MGPKNSTGIIRKILFANQDKKQIFFAFIGVIIGFVFMFISFHYLLEMNKLNKNKEILNENILVVQKKVNSSSTLSISANHFSINEINFYNEIAFIEKLAIIENNNFPVELQSNDPLVPYFRSDIFIQSIPTSFLDVRSSLWKWQKNDSIVPIILPRDFVYMMNNFLATSSMPQLSDEILKDVSFNIQLGVGSNSKKYKAKIIGFTNELNSILVPENFLNFGKNIFSLENKQKITQIMFMPKKGKFGLVEDLLKRNNLEVKKNQLVEGRLKSILTILLSSISVISVIVVMISVIVLLQYIQLLITKNAYEIKTMLRIGVKISTLVTGYMRYLFFGFLIVIISISIIIVFVNNKINLMKN